MTKEAEHNRGPEQAAGPQPVPDTRAELMRQIQRALIVDGGLRLEDDRSDGFDPYNNRVTPTTGQWRVRRRD